METHASRAYQHLRKKLLSGELKPGTRLLYGPIGKEIGVSATPVREAAGHLANEGLLELVPQRGAVVRTLGRENLIEIYEVREVIEPRTAALAAERATAAQLAQIEAELLRMRELALELKSSSDVFADKRLAALFDRSDCAFHLHIIEATGNQALVRTATQSHMLTRVFGTHRHRYDAQAMQITCADHQKIFDAIKRRDSEAASQAAVEHIRRGLTISLRALDAAEHPL